MSVGKVAGGGIGLLILVVLSLVLGIDPTPLLTGGGGGPPPGATGERGAPDDSAGARVSVVLASTEDTWRQLFAEAGREYREPTLVLFDDAVHSACGMAESAVGPFYCPGDGQVYIDLSFFNALADRFGAPGDFAQAYVVAHEVGHHVQNLLGTSDRIRQAQRDASRTDANALSVLLELQADCYAGVWASHAADERGFLEEGDIEEALGAASAIGDDALQRRSQGTVVPESFTHGTSAQRVGWFRTGLRSGDPDACDTLSAPAP